jgi:type IV fimbrial biogenesis protein FimT
MRYNTRAFTLPELLTTLGILTVLTSVAVPGTMQFMDNQQLVTSSNHLAADLLLARSESIKRRKPVLVDNGDGNWQSGWQVYVDLNNNGRFDEGEPILRQGQPLPRNVIAKGNTPVRRYVRYTPSGSSHLIGGAFQAGTLFICHASGKYAVRQLVLNATGRVRRHKAPPAPC